MASATILIADDQSDLRVLMRRLLTRKHDWDVLEAADGPQALVVWREHEIDLAILDQRMPGLTGTEVARQLRGEDFSGPIMLFSAYLDPDIEAEAQALDLLTVPKSDIRQLVSVAASALGRGAAPA